MDPRFTLNHMDAHALAVSRFDECYSLARSYAGIKVGQYWSKDEFVDFLISVPLLYVHEDDGDHLRLHDVRLALDEAYHAKNPQALKWECVNFKWAPLSQITASSRLEAHYASLHCDVSSYMIENGLKDSSIYFSLRGEEFDVAIVLESLRISELMLAVKLAIREVSLGKSTVGSAFKAVKLLKRALDEITW